MIAVYATHNQITGSTAAISTVRIEYAPNGTQIIEAKRKIHIIDLNAPFRVTIFFDIATYTPYERELRTMSRSPRVVCDENEAFRGSMRKTTPVHASRMPMTLIGRG